MKEEIIIALQDFGYPNTIMDYGLQLGKSLKLPCHLIGIINVPAAVKPLAIVGDAFVQPQMLNMTDIQQNAALRLEKITALGRQQWEHLDYQVSIGFPEPKLISKTEERNPLLVLVEQYNEYNYANELFGTYETRLAAGISAPTLFVPKDIIPQHLTRILYILDKDAYDYGNVASLAKVIHQTGAHLDVALLSSDVILAPKIQELTRIMESFIGEEHISYHKVSEENADEEIDKLQKKLMTNWLCINFKEQNLWEYLTNRRASERLILKTPIPVLVI